MGSAENAARTASYLESLYLICDRTTAPRSSDEINNEIKHGIYIQFIVETATTDALFVCNVWERYQSQVEVAARGR